MFLNVNSGSIVFVIFIAILNCVFIVATALAIAYGVHRIYFGG